MPDNVDINAKKISRDKEQHYKIIGGLIHQEAIAILNTYASNNITSKCMKQKLITERRNGEIHS